MAHWESEHWDRATHVRLELRPGRKGRDGFPENFPFLGCCDQS